MPTTVTLDIYSGLPNPSWHLTDDQEKELTKRLEASSTPAHSQPSGIDQLGYRGMLVARNDDGHAPGSRFRVYENIVYYGPNSPNYVADSDMESWLLSTNPNSAQVSESTRRQISSRLAVPPADKSSKKAQQPTANHGCNAVDAQRYDPDRWNNNQEASIRSNCYNYAVDVMGTYDGRGVFIPGNAGGWPIAELTCNRVAQSAQHDGLMIVKDFSSKLAKGDGWYVALVVWPGHDFHWYRQDSDGFWSHKFQVEGVQNRDSEGNKITDPKTCARGDYTDFCCYMIAKKGLTFS